MQHQTANYPITTATFSYTPSYLLPSTTSKKRKLNEVSGYHEGLDKQFGRQMKRLLRTQTDCKEAVAGNEESHNQVYDSTFESVDQMY